MQYSAVIIQYLDIVFFAFPKNKRNNDIHVYIYSLWGLYKIVVLNFLASDKKCLSQCRFLDAQELSWPIQSRTLSVMTFCKERWQVNQLSAEHPENFETIR